ASPTPATVALTAAASAVPAAPASGDPASGSPASWVAVDGRWRLGVASGAHRKEEAEYVGAGVRAHTRARLLAELTARIDGLDAELAAARERLRLATERRDGLRTAARELPRGAELDRAWTLWESAVRAEAAAERELAAAREKARALTTAAAVARRRAEATASGADLPTDPARLDELRRQLDRLLTDVERLRGGVAELSTLTRRHPDLLAGYRAAEAAAQKSATDATAARERHEEARRELSEQASAIGASERELMAREADATGRRERANAATPAAEQTARLAVANKASAEADRRQALNELAEREREVIRVGQSLRTALLMPGLPQAAGMQPPTAVSDADLPADDVRARIRRLDDLAGEIAEHLDPPRADQTDTQIMRRGQELADALPGGLDAPMAERENIKVVEIHDDSGSHPVVVFAARISRELGEARTRLSDREQEVFRRFLLGELGDSLSRQMILARTLVDDMNQVLTEVRSSHGIGVRLVWEISGEVDADTRAAVDLLATSSGMRTQEENERLRAALHRMIESERREDPGVGYAVHLRKALDYRIWHTFDVRVTDPHGRERRLGPRTGLSQGEQRVVSYLVLFAAAAAHFTSLGQVEPTVPRLILLDDAFAKVDEPTHAKLLELLVDLDLDFILTSERLWGNAPAVPHLHVYECLRDPLARGIATLHYEWNGYRMRLVT
ncbi:TIGR02680 family protein, partial [Candidatus Protofrankia californiensis]|uniref:TIGR02680 family protein n=1 Tax=Candidatus Protofrankia californiensis TaxID=1839754 RepID=UPI001041689E